MSGLIEQHLTRLRTSTTHKIDLRHVSKWVEQNTYLGGKRYSFEGHEYQRYIMDHPATLKVVRKCSQVGLSEAALRLSAGLMGVMRNFTLIYVLPTASFAGVYGKTRLAPIISTSPVLKAAASDSGLDNQDVKQFGSNYLWMRGCSSETAPISVAADCLVIDEKSFCDPTILEVFQSRLSHSKYRWRFELSTPTYPNDAIDTSFQQSRRHWNSVRCHRCGHRFIPSYEEHVTVPGFDGSLYEITKENLHRIRYQEAYVRCPHCGGVPDLGLENREWVIENDSENWATAGFQVQPFDCPTIISPAYLIQASTTYSSKSKFKQFNLGMPSEDAENGLTGEDLDSLGLEMAGSPFTTHVMGVDLGQYSHFTVGSMDSEGRLGVVHMERVPLSKFRERYWQLKSEFRVSVTVSDIQPYTDLIQSISHDDQNLFGALYVTRNGLELFDVKQREADPDAALMGVRQVHVNRNAALDSLLADIRDGKLWVRKTSEWDLFKAHLQDMKRASATLRNGEFTSQWQKSSKGNDHYHHSLLYLSIANKMRGVATTSLLSGLSTVTKFKVQEPVTKRPR